LKAFMHYYEHNIGDYRKDTVHLTLLEHGIYRQLIDTYYLGESPLTTDIEKLMRTHSIRNADEQQAFKNVLSDFFELTKNGYIHKRCDKIIAEYHGKSQKARDSANARWANRDKVVNANALRTQSKGNATQNTEHKTQDTKHKDKVAAAPVVLPDWIPLETWEAYLAMRKKIKKPPTDYAMKLIVDKLEKFKANGQDVKKVLEKSITAGWQDVFEIHDKTFGNKFDVAHTTTPPPPNQDAALKKIEEGRKKAVPPPADIKAKMAELIKGMKA